MSDRTWIIIVVLLNLAIWAGVLKINQLKNTPNWHCAAEDEVVVINNKCVHIDEIVGER